MSENPKFVLNPYFVTGSDYKLEFKVCYIGCPFGKNLQSAQIQFCVPLLCTKRSFVHSFFVGNFIVVRIQKPFFEEQSRVRRSVSKNSGAKAYQSFIWQNCKFFHVKNHKCCCCKTFMSYIRGLEPFRETLSLKVRIAKYVVSKPSFAS